MERSVTFTKVTGLACNFTKSNTPPWVFLTFLKLYKWCQIAQQNIAYSNNATGFSNNNNHVNTK